MRGDQLLAFLLPWELEITQANWLWSSLGKFCFVSFFVTLGTEIRALCLVGSDKLRFAQALSAVVLGSRTTNEGQGTQNSVYSK